MVASASTKVLGDLIRDVRRQFGDLDSVQILDDDIASWCNQGQLQLVSDNDFNEWKATVLSVAGTAEYTLPADLVKVKSVTYGGAIMTAMGFEEATRRYGQYFDAAGIPTVWYTWGGALTLYPKPNAGGQNIIVYYTKTPTPVGNKSDPLTVPDTYYNALLNYVLAKSYEMDEQTEQFAAAKMQYDSAIKDLANRENIRGGANLVVTDSAYQDYEDPWYYYG